jgi:hypothetical protein
MMIFMRSLIVGVLILVLTFVAYAQEQGFSTQSLWQLSLDALPESANRIFYGDTVVYYFEDDQLNVIDLQTGEALWQIDYPLSKTSYALLPVNGDGLVFVPKDKTLEALNEQVTWFGHINYQNHLMKFSLRHSIKQESHMAVAIFL